MPSIEDFVQDLSNGVKEVTIPKEKVTELSAGWYVSRYNFPHRGAKKSWRNGRLHAFDMGDHYSVHMDRVDPKDHSIGHLIEDAPFMLFLWDEFRDASKSIGEARRGVPGSINVRWLPHIAVGIALILVGAFIVLYNTLALEFVYRASALGLLGIGLVLVVKGLRIERGRKAGLNDTLAGAAATVLSLAIFLQPGIAFWLILLMMAVWTLGSGIFLVFGQGDKLQFNSGSVAPIIIGVISMAMSIMIFINPISGLSAVVILAGLLIAFIGTTQMAIGIIHGRFLAIGTGERK